jgi:hypothetical protein
VDEERRAVATHRLLNQVSVVTGGIDTARRAIAAGELAVAEEALEAAGRQASVLALGLCEVVLGEAVIDIDAPVQQSR